MRSFALVLLALSLSGCANFFLFEGQRYSTKSEALSAVQSQSSAAVQSIKPLPKPLVDKTLIVTVPTVAAISAIQLHRGRKVEPGFTPDEMGRERLDYMAEQLVLQYHAAGEAVKARGI